MAIRVEIDGKGKVAEFPDGTDPAIIDKVIKRDYFSQPKSGSTPDANYTTDPRVIEQRRREFVANTAKPITRIKEGAKDIVRDAMPYARPIIEGIGATGGAILGGGGGGLAGLAGGPAAPGTVPYGAIAGGTAGAALGYAGGAKLSDLIETSAGANSRQQPTTVTGQVGQSLKDIGTGAMYEMGGQAAAPVVSLASKAVGKVAKPVLGRLSGVGPGAIDEAIASGAKPPNSYNPLKSTTAFDRALRGEVNGEEIVDTARNALASLKDKRLNAYQTKMQQVAGQNTAIDIRPIKQEVSSLMGKYNVKVDPATGDLDLSRIAMGKTGRNDIKEIIETVSSWGTKQGDSTAMGLDTLKRQLDDFYSDSSQARQFVTQLRNKVKDTIVSKVPQYDEMTKGYSDATKLIKDVEADLMLRKQGMDGRITADKTLRRLMSSMRDNFEMRKELVDILGAKTGNDLAGEVAGYTMSQTIPRGLIGSGAGISAGIATYVNPQFWPLLAASSPRVQGEFLRMLGKGMKTAKAAAPIAGAASRQIAIASEDNK